MAGNATSTDAGLADAWVGVNQEFRSDGERPALLGFAEVALHERQGSSRASFRSAMVGLTTYAAIDPVVFSLTAALRASRARPDGTVSWRPGQLLLVNPSVAFAVNDRVTLTTGLQWTRRAADHRDGQPQGLARTATDLLLGVGYGMSRGNTLNTTFKANASGRGGAELRVSWLRTL